MAVKGWWRSYNHVTLSTPGLHCWQTYLHQVVLGENPYPFGNHAKNPVGCKNLIRAFPEGQIPQSYSPGCSANPW
jgi:hypothetical protein